MTTIVTKWVDRGSISFYGNVITGSASTSFGTISNTQNGSRDLDIDSLYSGADVISLTHNSGTGTLTFSLTGTRANSGWATISIGGTSFSRSAATYSTSGGNTYWNWSLSATVFGSSNGDDKEIIWDDGGTTVTAPTASSVIITGGTSAQENTTATVNLSNTGSGGTLEYACEVGDTTPDNWQSSNTFTIGRGSGTVYARARRSSTTNSNVVNTSQAAFLIGDSSFSRTSPTIAHDDTSATTTIQYATAGETLAIRVDGESTNLVTAAVASSSSPQNITFSSSLPSAGNSETYRFFVRRPTSTGGDGSTFNSTGMTFTVTRGSVPAPDAPTNLSFSTATTASSSTSVTVTASGGGTGTLKVSADGSTWVANGTSFESRTRGTAHTWYARVEGTSNSSNYTEAHTPPYLAPDASISAISSPNLAYGSTTHVVTIAGGNASDQYYVYNNTGSVNYGGRTGNGTLTITHGVAAGGAATFRVYTRKPVNVGGDNAFDDTGTTFEVEVYPNSTSLSVSNDNPSAASVTVTLSATGGQGGTIEYAKTSYSGTTTYAQNRGTTVTYYSRSGGGNGLISTVSSVNHAVGYLSPAGGTPGNPNIFTGGTSHTASISGGSSGTVYEFRSGSYTGTILNTVNGNGSAACSGGAGTYYVTRYKTTGTGGSGTTGRTNLATYTVTAISKQTFTIKINYIPAETGTPPFLLAPTVTVDVGSITGSVTNSSNPLEVSVGDDVIWKRNLVQNTVTISALNNFTSNSDIAATIGGVTRTLANGTNNTDAMTVLVSGGGNGSDADTYYIERVGGINPPSGLSSSLSGNESQTETVSLSLSTSGSNGTLEYLQRTVTSMSSTGWQTSNQFSQPRNSTRYYYASRNRNSGSFTGPLTVTVNYLGAVTTGYSFDTTSGNIGYGDGAPAISFTAAQANHTVAVFEGTTARSSGVTGTTDHNNIATNETPPAGGSNTYNLRTYRNYTAGGNPSPTYVATEDAGTIEIKRYPQTPTLSYTDNSATVENATTTATLTLSNTDGVSTYWFRRVNDGTSFGNYIEDSNNVVAYADQTRSANQAYDYQGRIVGANGLVSESAVINAQQLTKRYLDPKSFNYSTPATISYVATSHTLTITGADSDHTYGWGIGVVGKGTAAHSGSSTVTISSNSALPNAGGEYNYEVLAKRGTSSGGSGSFVSIATNLNVKRYPQTPSGLTTFTDAGTAAASGTFTVAVGALDGASSTTITLSSNYTTNAVANGSAIANVVRAGDVIYARNTGANNLTAQAAISTPATYLSPDLSVTATNDSITNTATSASTTIGGMTAGQTVAIRLNNGTTNLATRVGNGALSFTGSLPTYGNSETYELFTSRPTSAGGSAAFVATDDTFTVTRAAANSAPTAFDFTNQSGVSLSSTRTSANTVTIAGLSSGTSLNVSISGGTYSKNGAAYASANTTTENGDTFKLRHTSSGSFSTATTTTLTVGTGTGSFVSTTIGAPTYSVTAPTSINEGSSGTINVTTANVANNTTLYYKVEGVPFSTSNINAADFGGTVPSGSFTISSNAGSFTVTPTADLTTDGQETARVTIRTGSTSGTVVATDDFLIIDTSTTPDTTPNAFTFTDATGDFGTQQNAAVQITGIDTSTTVSRSSGAATFTVSSSATTPSSGFSGTNKSITNNQYIHIRQNCSNTYGAVLETEITVGGVSDTWSVTTNAAPSDSTPDPYSFTDATVAVSTETTTSVQIQGLSATAVAERTSGAALFAVSTSGSSAPSSSSFTNADKNITNNQYLWLKQTSSSSNSTTLSSVFSVGGVSRTWNLTTVAAGGGSGNYGLQIFPATGSIARLDTSDRTIRVLGLHTGTVAVGSSATITQPGFSSSDATLGIEWQATGDHPEFYSLSSSGTSITISRSSSDTGGLSTYNLRIFRL